MHGSRRRLDERLAHPIETRGRSSCMTIDSFAGQLLRRWQSIAGALPDARLFDEVCDLCGRLLERPEIGRWVAATFPIVAIDEAQELKPCRLRIVRALTEHTHTVIAADEFQCLDQEVDTGPFVEWFHTGDIQRLVQVRRTNRQGLLDAAAALRRGTAPARGVGIKINTSIPTKCRLRSVMPSTAPGHQPCWSRQVRLDASDLVSRLSQGFRSARQIINPVRIGGIRRVRRG